ncbi:MAG: c-type cytochrome [Comamonadaceae bacterium]|nr:c-type cytochrome [Comamonadaceae bacterium]
MSWTRRSPPDPPGRHCGPCLQALPFEGSIGKGPGTDLARGKELYERDCAACHGASGQGDAAKFYPMVSAQHYRYLLREVIAIRDGSQGQLQRRDGQGGQSPTPRRRLRPCRTTCPRWRRQP